MHIKNVTLFTSSKNIWLCFGLFITFCVLSVLLTAEFIDFSEPYMLPVEILKSAWVMISSTKDYEEKFMLLLCVYFLPAFFIGGTIWSIISRNNALKSENSVLNLRDVEFMNSRIKFNFNHANCNFSCRYEDIQSLNMEINVSKERTKNGYVNVVNYIALHFLVLGNKRFTLTNTTVNFKGMIYNIIDYTRGVQSFKYTYSGNGEHDDLDEIIKSYLEKGMKPILTRAQENSFKELSILFFIIGIFFIFIFANEIAKSNFDVGLLLIILFAPSVLILLSLIFDILLIIDKIHEKRYEGVATWKKKHSKNDLKI